VGRTEADRRGPESVAVVFEDLAGFPDKIPDAAAGDRQQVGEHIQGADLPLVDQGEQQPCRIVEKRLGAQLAGGPTCPPAALFGVALLCPDGLGWEEMPRITVPVCCWSGRSAGDRPAGRARPDGVRPARMTRPLAPPRSSWRVGVQGVVQGAVSGVPPKRQRGEALLADRDADRVVAGVQHCFDAQPSAGAGRLDGLEHDLVTGQGATLPVERDMREQPKFDLVPFRCARREVADRDCQPDFRRQRRQFALPHSVAVTGGATRVGGDQQSRRVRIAEAAAYCPPAADRLAGEHGRVVVDTDVHPPGVAGDVVEPVRDGLFHLQAGEEEVVILDLDWFTGRSPLAPGHGQPPQLSRFLVSTLIQR